MADERPVGPSRGRLRKLLVGYLVLLGISHVVWLARDTSVRPGPDGRVFEARVVDGGERGERRISIAYRDDGPGGDAPVVVLLHGNPGGFQDFRDVAPGLAERYRVIVPDLPGFGSSRVPVPDYSVEAHALYVQELLEGLGIERAHLVGFSMSGGVMLELSRFDPERVASITMLSAIGIQEMELFGEHTLNHAVHGLQLAAVHTARWLFPHFGSFDAFPLNVPYARNFYDTDQRPLRGLLEAYQGPMLIVHGEHDFLVPPEAAREHHRIVPQSELTMVADQSHFLLWFWADELVAELDRFLRSVEAGEAAVRAGASAERLALAAEPFDPADVPPFSGATVLVVMLLLAASTLVSEDLACVGAGFLVAQGRLGFVPGVAGCFIGIFLGDMMLFFLGRWLGRPAIRRRPLKWIVSEASVDRASEWYRRYGGRVVFLSRLTPGLRLPTYFAAGVLRTRVSTFAFYFVLAGLVWTPFLVGISSWAGLEVQNSIDVFGEYTILALFAIVAVLVVVQRILVPSFTWRGRRRLVGSWRRKVRYEFWPPWIYYLPVFLYVVWLSIRHRSFALVTAANPGIPTGGFIGESKSGILESLGDSEEVATWVHLPSSSSPDERVRRAEAFLVEHGLDFPVVLKPDVGQRGSGVRILRTAGELESAVRGLAVDAILQQFAPGPEFGVFYYRLPGEEDGRIFSITEKRLPVVVGDGERTLEELILADPRAVAMARTYLDANASRVYDVPAAGQEIELVELGTHCRGAIFLDGSWAMTPELVASVDRISKRFDGFWFGRYDVRVEDPQELRAGRGFKVLELNGLTSEATHVYDPKVGLRRAYSTLFEQWRIAFEIARRNVERGARPAKLRELVREVFAYRRTAAAHPSDTASSETAAANP